MAKYQKKPAILIAINEDGTQTETEVYPSNGKSFTLEELRGFVGGTIDIQLLKKANKWLIVNDNGKLIGLKENEIASEMWRKEYPISKFPYNNDGLIVGNVLLSPKHLIR
jgi:hypothetical protein